MRCTAGNPTVHRPGGAAGGSGCVPVSPAAPPFLPRRVSFPCDGAWAPCRWGTGPTAGRGMQWPVFRVDAWSGNGPLHPFGRCGSPVWMVWVLFAVVLWFRPKGRETVHRAVSKHRKNTAARARDARSMYGSHARMVSMIVGALRMPVMISAVQWALGKCRHGLRRLVSMISCMVPLFFAMVGPFSWSAAYPCLQCVRAGRAGAACQCASDTAGEPADPDSERNAYHAAGGCAYEPLGPFVACASPGAER